VKYSGFVSVFAVSVFLGLSLSAPPGHTEVYKWVDGSGTVWFSDDPAKLPKESYGRAEKQDLSEKAGEDTGAKRAGDFSTEEAVTSPPSETPPVDAAGRAEEKRALLEDISRLEKELSRARMALGRVSLTSRRGFWYIIDAGGNKVRASYKDPGARWSTSTWPGAPPATRTRESDERRRIQRDISEMEKNLGRMRERLSAVSRGL